MVNIIPKFGPGIRTAIVDVNEGGVSLSIVEHEHKVCTVLASGHSSLSFEERSAKQSIGLIAQQIKEAGDLALKSYAAQGQKAPITNAYAVIHAPWARTQTMHTGVRFKEDTVVKESSITDLAKQGLEAAKDIDHARLIETNVTRIEINGYPTQNPEGTHAQWIDAVSLVSDCDIEVKNAVAAGLESLFPVATISWRSGARAIAAFLEDTDLNDKNVLVIDMSTDTTHIIAASKGIFEQNVVPEGIRTILSKVAAGRLPEEALGYIRMLEREACSNEACEAVEKALAVAEPELARIFGEVIGKMAALQPVPNDLILITHPDLEGWLGKFFERIDFAQFTVTTQPFVVHTPATLGIDAWIHGENLAPALAVDCALVNIEASY